MKTKSNSVITTAIDTAARTLTFSVIGAGEIVLDLNRVHVANVDYAAFHGFKQRIADKAALPRDETTGKPASPGDKYEAMRELAEHFMSGSADWSTRREGGINEGGLLFRALTELYPAKTPEEIKAFLGGKTAKEKAGILASEKVAPVANRIRAEAGKGIDAESLLAGL